MKKRKKHSDSTGIAFMALGIGIVLVCIFPSQWMIVLMAAALVAAGCMLIKSNR